MVTTEETPEELVNRLGPVTEVGAVEDTWCFTAPSDIASSRRGLDSLAMRVRFARAKIGEWRNPKYVSEIQVPLRRNIELPERGIGGAPVKMIGEDATKRRSPQHPHKKKG